MIYKDDEFIKFMNGHTEISSPEGAAEIIYSNYKFIAEAENCKWIICNIICILKTNNKYEITWVSKKYYPWVNNFIEYLKNRFELSIFE